MKQAEPRSSEDTRFAPDSRAWESGAIFRRLAASAVLAALTALVLPAVAAASYDRFDDETVNDLNSFGQEVPYESGAPRQFTATFDSSAFTLEPGEGEETGNLNGCLKPEGVVYGGRTGWVRFNPGVAGRLHAIAQTPGYDSVIWIREGREAAFRTASFSDVRGRSQTCADVNAVAGDEEAQLDATAEHVYYVQVGGKCPAGRESCGDPSVPGGPTTVRLTFTPFDADGDGVPDTREGAGCQGQGEPGRVTADGCPDTDGDAIRDSEEGPGCVGQRGVAAAQPYNGCFDGPVPPTADGARVIITSLSGDPDNTSKVDVLLRLNWPKGAREAFANNGAGDPDVRIPLTAEPVPWTLRPAAKSETREVVVTFRGPDINAADDDIITLDPTAPRVTEYVLSRSRGKRWYVGVLAADDRNGSGVRDIAVLDRRRRLLREIQLCGGRTCEARVAKGLRRIKGKPRFLRVTDAAGNSRRRKIAVTSARCRILVYERIEVTNFACFQPGDRCKPRRFNWADRGLKCVKRKSERHPRVRRR